MEHLPAETMMNICSRLSDRDLVKFMETSQTNFFYV